MPINFGPEWEQAVLALDSCTPSGFTGGNIDPGSLEIAQLNPNGTTTVRCTLVLSVDTEQLKQTMLDVLGTAG